MGFDVSAIGRPLDERYPADLAAASLAALQGLLPSWVVRNGAVEVLLIEALALSAAEVANAANVAVGAIEEDMLSRFDQVLRLPGAPAVGALTLTFDAADGPGLDAGVRFVLRDVGVEVVSAMPVPAGASVLVPVTASVASSRPNGVGPGAQVDVLDIVPNLLDVQVSEVFAGGADPESDEEYIARARWRRARASSSVAKPDAFAALVLEDGRVANAAAVRAWDGVSVGAIGTLGGHVTVLTYGRGGQVPVSVREELAATLASMSAAGVVAHVVPAALTTVDVTVTVTARPGFAAAEVQAGVQSAVRAFLAPEAWAFGEDVGVLALAGEIAKVASVDYVSAMSSPSSDVAVAANALAVAGAVTVSVI